MTPPGARAPHGEHEPMLEALTDALADLKEEVALELVRTELSTGTDPASILRAGQRGMTEVGGRFESGEYYISDLMMSGAIFKQVAALLEPLLESEQRESGGSVVIGTVRGDIHDIGKDIVVGMLQSANLEVIDLGVDVSPERFVDAVTETRTTVLALSGLLTLAFDSMAKTIAAIEEAGLRDDVKIMVGGGPVDERVCKGVGADGWGADAQAAVRLAATWLTSDPTG